MDIPPLKTETDHANAVAEIETLMDAEPGSEEFDRLEVLSALVDAYESGVHPIAAPQPTRYSTKRTALPRLGEG